MSIDGAPHRLLVNLGYPCDHKARYMSREEAKGALKSARAYAEGTANKKYGRKLKHRQEKRSYLCGDCGFWHLTSMTKEEYDKLN